MSAALKRSENKLATQTSAEVVILQVPKRGPEPSKRSPNKLEFSDLWAARVKPQAKAVVYWDTKQTGLSLLVGHGGTKTFRSTYQVGGRSVTRKIGRLFENTLDRTRKNWSVTAARDVVSHDRAMALLKTDPEVERAKQEKEAKASAYTIGEAIAQYIEEEAKPHQKTWDQTELNLRRTCAGFLDRPVRDVTRDDIREVIKAHRARGKERMAQMSLQWIKRLYTWLAEQEIIPENTMALLTMKFRTGTRDKVYTDAELKAFWEGCGQAQCR